MNYFISDLHFGHKNVLKFDNRPFKTIEEHDKYLIKKWNETVNIDDDVYILGDISWYNSTKTIEIFKNLNGNKHLIKGNHDNKILRNAKLRELFMEIVDYKELYIDNNLIIVLSHYPMPCFNKRFYGSYHLYGHVHNSLDWNVIENTRKELEKITHKACLMYNVGAMMDYINYTPRTLDEIIAGCKY